MSCVVNVPVGESENNVDNSHRSHDFLDFFSDCFLVFLMEKEIFVFSYPSEKL